MCKQSILLGRHLNRAVNLKSPNKILIWKARNTNIRIRTVPSWSCSQAVSKLVWLIQLQCVQWKTPDDGHRNFPIHVAFYSKNKFEKLVHLVGFIIRIYLSVEYYLPIWRLALNCGHNITRQEREITLPWTLRSSVHTLHRTLWAQNMWTCCAVCNNVCASLKIRYAFKKCSTKSLCGDELRYWKRRKRSETRLSYFKLIIWFTYYFRNARGVLVVSCQVNFIKCAHSGRSCLSVRLLHLQNYSADLDVIKSWV